MSTQGDGEIQGCRELFAQEIESPFSTIDRVDQSSQVILPSGAANPDQPRIDEIIARFRIGTHMVPLQCRAARAFLGMTQTELAVLAGVTISTVVDFERQRRQVASGLIGAIGYELQTAGIIFIHKDMDGVGVMIRSK